MYCRRFRANVHLFATWARIGRAQGCFLVETIEECFELFEGRPAEQKALKEVAAKAFPGMV
jgi:hypothetical protein